MIQIFSLQRNSAIITENKSEIKLSNLEFICPIMCFRRKKKLVLLKKSKDVIIHKLSVENIIEKFYKVDQIAQMVLSENQIKEYYQADRVLFDEEMKTFNINKKFEEQMEDIIGQSEFNKTVIEPNCNQTKNVCNSEVEKRQITI